MSALHLTSRRQTDYADGEMRIDPGVPMLLGMLLLPAVTFALAFPSIVTHLSRGLVSSYLKADVRKRFTAAFIDGLMVVTLCLVSRSLGWLLSMAFGGAYLLLRDALAGKASGNFCSASW